jgi:poly(A) polymerase
LYTTWLANHRNILPIFITDAVKPDLPRVLGMFDTWDPQRESCKEELLPILNPAYPHANTCYTVGRSGLEWFYKEITRAHGLLSGAVPVRIEELFEPYAIGDDFHEFLIVDVSVTGDDARNEFEPWCLYVESKLRLLLYGVEAVVDARMYPKRIPNPRKPTGTSSLFAIGVKRRDAEAQTSAAAFASPIAPSNKIPLFFFSEAIDDFKYAVLVSGVKPPFGFQRNERTMNEPTFDVISSHHVECPEELKPKARKRFRDDHEMGLLSNCSSATSEPSNGSAPPHNHENVRLSISSNCDSSRTRSGA